MNNAMSQKEIVRKSLKRRYRKEQRFKFYGILAIVIALSALVILFADIIGKGYTGFIKTTVTLEVQLDPEVMYLEDPTDAEAFSMADFKAPLVVALELGMCHVVTLHEEAQPFLRERVE